MSEINLGIFKGGTLMNFDEERSNLIFKGGTLMNFFFNFDDFIVKLFFLLQNDDFIG